MEESASKSPPRSSAAQRLIDALLNIIRNRVELFALDLREERLWLVSTFVWISVSFFFGFASLIVITLTAVEFSPEKLRPFVFLGFAIFYVLVTTVALLTLRKKLRDRPSPFSDTIAELKKDMSCLRPRD